MKKKKKKKFVLIVIMIEIITINKMVMMNKRIYIIRT